VNGGSVTHVKENGKSILRLSADFQIPGSPDPHWQVIDSKGKAHLLQALKVKEGLSNREVVLPEHVPNVARVQIWCAFAEVILGEASFDQPIKVNGCEGPLTETRFASAAYSQRAVNKETIQGES
jgi:hypothetical protein